MCYRSRSICAEQPIVANNLRLYTGAPVQTNLAEFSRIFFPAITTIDMDNEDNYDVPSFVAFCEMLIKMAITITFCPFERDDFWTGSLVQLQKNNPQAVLWWEPAMLRRRRTQRSENLGGLYPDRSSGIQHRSLHSCKRLDPFLGYQSTTTGTAIVRPPCSPGLPGSKEMEIPSSVARLSGRWTRFSFLRTAATRKRL